jgi:hypothetical protein
MRHLKTSSLRFNIEDTLITHSSKDTDLHKTDDSEQKATFEKIRRLLAPNLPPEKRLRYLRCGECLGQGKDHKCNVVAYCVMCGKRIKQQTGHNLANDSIAILEEARSALQIQPDFHFLSATLPKSIQHTIDADEDALPTIMRQLTDAFYRIFNNEMRSRLPEEMLKDAKIHFGVVVTPHFWSSQNPSERNIHFHAVGYSVGVRKVSEGNWRLCGASGVELTEEDRARLQRQWMMAVHEVLSKNHIRLSDTPQAPSGGFSLNWNTIPWHGSNHILENGQTCARAVRNICLYVTKSPWRDMTEKMAIEYDADQLRRIVDNHGPKGLELLRRFGFMAKNLIGRFKELLGLIPKVATPQFRGVR